MTRKDRVRRGRAFAGLELLEGRTLMAGAVLYRINAGGPSLSGDPLGRGYLERPSGYRTPRRRGSTSSTSNSIDLSDPSIAARTPRPSSRRTDGTGSPARRCNGASRHPGPLRGPALLRGDRPGPPGRRSPAFERRAGGGQVLNNYDVYADVGGYKGVVKSFVVSSDATLNVGLIHEIADPSIKGIEILAAQESNQLAASPGPLLFDSVRSVSRRAGPSP